MLADIKTVMDTIRGIHWVRILDFFKLLYTRQPAALIVAIILLLGSVILVGIYWNRSAEYELIVRQTLEDQSVPTPQQYKGIDAFIMSNVPTGLDEALKNELVNDRFTVKLRDLQRQLQQFATGQRPKALNLRLIQDQQQRSVITNQQTTEGFLFLPLQLIRTAKEMPNLSGTAPNEEVIKSWLSADPALQTDVEFAEFIAPQLKAFIGTSMAMDSPSREPEIGKSEANPNMPHDYLGLTPKQVYVITKNGVLRIFNSADRPSIYEFQFPATTFFPSRPYFWPTFEENRVTTDLDKLIPAKLGEFFHISKPYMDLGGNGIVMTLSRGLKVEGLPQAVVCFDLAFLPQRSLAGTLKDRVNQLGGETVPVKCTIPRSGSVSCAAEELGGNNAKRKFQNDLSVEMQNFFQKKVETDQRSEVFGSIQRINPPNSSALHVAVPIEESAESDTQVGRFLLFTLDLTSYRDNTTYVALAAGTTFGGMTLLLAYLWGSMVRRHREYQEAFRRVAEVMYYSPTPYARVDSLDKICDVNPAFAKLLEYSAEELCGRNFKSLSEIKSRKRYEEVLKRRQSGEPVEPYELTLQTSNGQKVHVTVVAAPVPSDSLGELPETFGILLTDKPSVGVTLPFVSAKGRI